MYNNFSLLNIIGGISKTLNIANQMIPIYKQVKPLLTDSNKIFNNLQNIKTNLTQPNKVTNKNNQTIQNTKPSITSVNAPTFFQ